MTLLGILQPMSQPSKMPQKRAKTGTLLRNRNRSSRAAAGFRVLFNIRVMREN